MDHHNNVRLNSAIGRITPKDMLGGCRKEIHAERDRKLEAARRHRLGQLFQQSLLAGDLLRMMIIRQQFVYQFWIDCHCSPIQIRRT